MVRFSRDHEKIFTFDLDFAQLGELNNKNTGVVIFHEITYFDQDGFERELLISNETRKFIDFRYAEKTVDKSKLVDDKTADSIFHKAQ
jgi:hypothetical protein